MSKIQDYLDQRQGESKQFWDKLLSDPGNPIPRAEALSRLKASATTAPPRPARDLAAEQVELYDLLHYLPWLKLRMACDTISIPLETLKAYLSPPASSRFRPLRNEQDADVLWALLRDTAHFIRISLPEQFQQMPPPLPQ